MKNILLAIRIFFPYASWTGIYSDRFEAEYLHFLILSPFPLYFLNLSPFSRSRAARLPQVVQPWLTLKYKYLLMTTFCLGVTQHDVLPFLSSASRHDSQFQTYFIQFHTISI